MGKLKRFLPAAALIGLCALIFSLRLHTYDEPLERDLTTYAVIAHQMLNGKSLYSDLWDHKPPAIYVTHALAILLVGQGPGAIYLLNVAAAVATLLGVYVAASAVGGFAAGSGARCSGRSSPATCGCRPTSPTPRSSSTPVSSGHSPFSSMPAVGRASGAFSRWEASSPEALR